MYLKNSFLVLLLLLSACRGREEAPSIPKTTAAPESAYAHPEALIEAEELQAVRGHKHIRLVDFREREAFDKGHLPGAIPLWRSDIEDPAHQVEGMMATKPEMEKLFSELGVSPLDTLILYDDQGGVNAARLWWVLKAYGFEPVRLLNGGIDSWNAMEGEVSTIYEPAPSRKFRFPMEDPPHIKIDKDSLRSVLETGDWTLIDARTPEEYSGKRMKKGAQKAGHIPGSVNIDWARAVHYHGSKKFRPVEELKAIYKDLPEDNDHPIVVYCHSGVRSAHTSFVLTQLLGYNRVYNYDGSWLEWSAAEGTPIEKDSTTLILQ
jgi:thiosulfate/3-mercaptopyruvate sulfurtransferase